MERVAPARPDWLDRPPADGGWRDLALAAPAIGAEPVARVWSPAEPTDRLLVVHDGPDYDHRANLARFAAASIAAGRVPPFHLALLPAGDRLEWYSASPAYAKALTGQILPHLTAALG